ncbi:MAG: hypothetical protein AWU57_515 [Marinobacter sp. T13-3]|nr:MAG: hypothetical protein AWU57_515 [Marinobacter sp. T13-3]
MKMVRTQKQGGFALAELLLAGMIASIMFASIAMFLDAQRRDRTTTEYAGWMAQYVNAVASYVATQGATPPTTLTQTGTDWLKSTNCGGTIAPEDAKLGCDVPTNFNGVYGLDMATGPTVTFDWSIPRTPTADITFGVIETAGEPNTQIAAALSAEINRQVAIEGDNFAGTYIIDPAVPATDVANFRNEVRSANLRGYVDFRNDSTVFVRRNGSTVITGPLVTKHDKWVFIGRDENDVENSEPQDIAASGNLNDLYVRSAGPDANGDGKPDGMWASEIGDLAGEAFKLAARSPQVVSEVVPGTRIDMPTCPATLSPRVHTYPAEFAGGGNRNDAKEIMGVRTPVTTNVATRQWTVHMEILYSGETIWHPTPTDMGRIGVIIKCSP